MPPELRDVQQISSALTQIERRWPAKQETAVADQETPVFIFSAGWRSGSTLLQRLICSTGEIVIWGEPLGDAAVIPKLASTLAIFSDEWPPDDVFGKHIDLKEFADSWIANETPDMNWFKQAHRAIIATWLDKPAKDMYGTNRWGMKEVRLTIEHAKYLKWLYPNARFVFIYRNLFDAYRSWRGNTWSSSWPGYFSWSPIAYARHWKLLLGGYIKDCEKVGGYMVKYEDLISGKVNLDELANYIGISRIDGAVLKKRIGSPEKSYKTKKRWISPIEGVLLRLIAGKLMKQAGYY